MDKRIIRVFPRRTSYTPKDDYAFVGYPPLLRPEADEVRVSVTFTWDISEGEIIAKAWGQYYPTSLGGVACGSSCNGFEPGMYVKQGITFTSRGCNNHCPWCLVPEREGNIRELPIIPGNIIADNNLLQCNHVHIAKVLNMLRHQKSVQFSGGLDSRLLTTDIVDDLRALSIKSLFFACDTKGSLKQLKQASKMLSVFTREQLRCYVLLAYGNEAVPDAEERLIDVWQLGFMPFAQLYQPPDRYIRYSKEWRDLARTWSRPAATKAHMKR